MVHGEEYEEEEESEEEEEEEPVPFFDDARAEQLRQMQNMLKTLQGSIDALTRSATQGTTASRRASVADKKR